MSSSSTAGGTPPSKTRPSTAPTIGAAGPVTVTRFLMLDTIEERINLVLDEKRELFDTIFSGAEQRHKKLGMTQAEIFGLFDLRSPGGAIHYAA